MSANRLVEFKNKGRNSEEMRRRRIEQIVELRKARKGEQLLKRRNILSAASESTSPTPEEMNIEAFIQGIMSTDEQTQLVATVGARKILCRVRNPPIDAIIKCGAVPRFVEFLTRTQNPLLQYEACWALTNIVTGTTEHTQAVVGAGALPILQRLLASPRPDIAEQAMWALGNIAGDCAVMRDVVLDGAILPLLLQLIHPNTPISLLRITVWTLSNLCGNKNPAPNFELVKPALPVLASLLHHYDNAVVTDACWALAFITDGSNDKIQAVLDTTGLIGRLVELLGSYDVTVLSAALGALGNILTGNDTQTDFVLNAGVLLYMGYLLQHPHLHIVKEAAWTASNIAAGSAEQIQRMIDADVIAPLLNVLQRGAFKSQKEAAWAVMNFTIGGTVMQLYQLVKLGALGPVFNLLKSNHSKTVIVLLDSLGNILKAVDQLGEKVLVAVLIEECGGLDTLETLQLHYNEQISKKASLLIGHYFSEVETQENTFTLESSSI